MLTHWGAVIVNVNALCNVQQIVKCPDQGLWVTLYEQAERCFARALPVQGSLPIHSLMQGALSGSRCSGGGAAAHDGLWL